MQISTNSTSRNSKRVVIASREHGDSSPKAYTLDVHAVNDLYVGAQRSRRRSRSRSRSQSRSRSRSRSLAIKRESKSTDDVKDTNEASDGDIPLISRDQVHEECHSDSNNKTPRRNRNRRRSRFREMPLIFSPDARDRAHSYNNNRHHNLRRTRCPRSNMSPYKFRHIRGINSIHHSASSTCSPSFDSTSKSLTPQTPCSNFGFSPLSPSRNEENGLNFMSPTFQRFQCQSSQMVHDHLSQEILSEDVVSQDVVSQDIVSQEIVGHFPSEIADLSEPSLFPVLPIGINYCNMSRTNASQSMSILSPSQSVSRSLYLPSPSPEVPQELKHPLSYNMGNSNMNSLDIGVDVGRDESSEMKQEDSNQNIQNTDCESHTAREQCDGSLSSPDPMERSAAPEPPTPEMTFSMDIHSKIMRNGEFTMWPTGLMYAWMLAQEESEQNEVRPQQ